METYEQKYKSLVGKIKRAYMNAWTNSTKAVLEEIFPELKESEDERTRKEILNVFKQLGKGTTICGRNYDYAKWIAWLEKQGENKQSLANSAKTCKKSQRMVSAEAKKALYDKPAWSDEDDVRLQACLDTLQAKSLMGVVDTNMTKWLKSIKQRIKGE